MNAVAYLRVSTKDQATEGYSLPAQERDIHAFTKAKGLELLHVYTDVMSGKNVKSRPALLRLMEDAKAKAFSQIIVWKIDRFGRNMRESLNLYAELDGYGVDVVSATQAFDSRTPSGKAFRNMLSLWAEFERDTIIERVKMGNAEKQRGGELLGTLPIGYRKGPLSVEADPIAGPLVSQTFALYAAGGVSLLDLTRWAHNVGFLTQEGRPHTKQSLHALLRNRVYTGVVVRDRRKGGEVLADGKHPALVTGEMFDYVQAELTAKRMLPTNVHFGRHTYPLTGVAKCAHCQVPLIGRLGGVTTHRRRYMRCATVDRNGKEACPQRMVSAELLESQVAAYLKTMRFNAPDLHLVLDQMEENMAQRSPDDEPDVSAITEELERWLRLYVDHSITWERYKQETTPLKSRLAGATGTHRNFDVERALDYLQDAGRLFSTMSLDHQRLFMQEVFEWMSVDDVQIVRWEPKPLYKPAFVIDWRERFGQDDEELQWSRGGRTRTYPIATTPIVPDEAWDYEPVLHPRTGAKLLIPALAM